MAKTPHTAFRLSDETRGQLAHIADQYETSMTDAVRRATAAFSQMSKSMEEARLREAATYPFEAYTDALMNYRAAKGYEVGEVIPQVDCDAVDYAVQGAIPHIRSEQEAHTLRDVIVRLEGFGVDEAVVQHFRDLVAH